MTIKSQTNTGYQGIICKANTGRNTLTHLKYYRGTNQFDKNPTIHHVINARSMSIVSNLKPL